jgi:phosphoglycolate phosphatase
VIAAVFDLDGTLIDSAPAIMGVGNRLLADLGQPPLDLAETRQFVGHGAARFVERALAARGVEPETAWRGGLEEAVALFERYYAEGDPRENVPYPGAREALGALRDAAIPLALCTNKPGAATAVVLEGLGWASLFPVVIAGDTLPQRKPAPEPLLEAMRRTGAARAVYVGDSEVDAEAAQRAGLPFLLFTEGYRHAPVEALPHDRAFSDFRTLPPLLRAIASR